METATEPAGLIPGSAIDLLVDALDEDHVDREQADAIRDALSRWYERNAPEHTPRTGVMNRWREGEDFGFAVESSTGQPWFVSRSNLLPGTVMIQKGTRVVFYGNPVRAPGRRYPQVQKISPDTGPPGLPGAG